MKNNILIVEDEEFLIQVLKDNLTIKNYVVDFAMDGQEALEKIEKNNPDLILLDILMPKKDGFYVLEKIKNHSELKLIPVVILSNLGEANAIKRAMDMGVNEYFIKSQHSIKDVVDKLKHHIKARKV